MAVPTVAEFRAHFPEWASGPADATIQSHLDAAEEETPLDIWGDQQDQGILYKAAYTLSNLPQSRDMRKTNEDGENIYWAERKKLAKQVAPGPWVAGSVSHVTGI